MYKPSPHCMGYCEHVMNGIILIKQHTQSSRLTDVSDEEAAGVVFILELVHSFHYDLNGQALLGGWAGAALLTLHCVLPILPVVHNDLLC